MSLIRFLVRATAVFAVVFLAQTLPAAACTLGPAQIFWQSSWYAGQVTKGPDSEGRCYVTYDGYDSSWDEWVTSDRLRQASAGASKAACPGGGIEILWRGEWYAGRVLKGPDNQGRCFITYDGYGSEWDEWVEAARMRR